MFRASKIVATEPRRAFRNVTSSPSSLIDRYRQRTTRYSTQTACQHNIQSFLAVSFPNFLFRWRATCNAQPVISVLPTEPAHPSETASSVRCLRPGGRAAGNVPSASKFRPSGRFERPPERSPVAPQTCRRASKSEHCTVQEEKPIGDRGRKVHGLRLGKRTAMAARRNERGRIPTHRADVPRWKCRPVM